MRTYSRGPLIFILISLFVAFQLRAQLEPPQISKDKNFNHPVGVYNASSAGAATNSATGLNERGPDLGEECSMYLADHWQPGTIHLVGNVVHERVPMRYNIYNQQIEFVIDGDTAAIGDPGLIEYIDLDGQVFVYGPFICNDQLKTGYMEVLSEGRMRLLVYRCIKYVTMDELTTAVAERTYHLEKTFLYAYPGENAEKLPERRKDIIRILQQDRPAIKSYLKANNNRLRSETEIVEAFNFYNEGF